MGYTCFNHQKETLSPRDSLQPYNVEVQYNLHIVLCTYKIFFILDIFYFCRVGLGSDDFPSSLPRSGQKTSAAKLYASPLTRPIPPPLSSIPRKEPLLLEMPPPLPPRHYTTDEEQTEDSRDSAGSAASSFISFLTGIGRKRQHTVPSVSTGEAVESTAERATNTLSEATDTGEDFSFENSVAYGIRLEIGHDGDFVRLINLQDDVRKCIVFCVSSGMSVQIC